MDVMNNYGVKDVVDWPSAAGLMIRILNPEMISSGNGGGESG